MKKPNQRLSYLASPYTHQDPAVRQARFEAACNAVAWWTRRGASVISPIAHSHPIVVLNPDLDGRWEYWQGLDETLIRACDEVIVLMLDGWRDSVGVTAEVEFAREHGKPLYYMTDTQLNEDKDRWHLQAQPQAATTQSTSGISSAMPESEKSSETSTDSRTPSSNLESSSQS